jgi:hypothetical protein
MRINKNGRDWTEEKAMNWAFGQDTLGQTFLYERSGWVLVLVEWVGLGPAAAAVSEVVDKLSDARSFF